MFIDVYDTVRLTQPFNVNREGGCSSPGDDDEESTFGEGRYDPFTSEGTAFFVVCRISKGASAQTRLIRVVTCNIEDDINGATTNYLDNGGAANIPARFYRIRLVS
jgi:hypothetical protein